MSDDVICPCGPSPHPREARNPPGRRTIDYRVGDFASFRAALLRALPGEEQLATWRPSPGGDDLALQLVEWWAYLADILTFYNERIAHDTYLRTASRREVAARITALIGHRPRPAIAAVGTVAALSTAKVPVKIPKALGVASKPSPGKGPMIVEVDKDTVLQPGGAIPVEEIAHDPIKTYDLLVSGVVSGIKTGDALVLKNQALADEGTTEDVYARMIVQSVSLEKSPSGKTNTRIVWANPVPAAQFPGGTPLADCRLFRAEESPLISGSKFAAHVVVSADTRTVMHLASVRDIKPGAQIVTRVKMGATTYKTRVFEVTSVSVNAWNEKGVNSPAEAPVGGAEILMNTQLGCLPKIAANDDLTSHVDDTLVLFGFRELGALISGPKAQSAGPSLALTAAQPLPAGLLVGAGVFVEDANGQGVRATVTHIAGKEISVHVDGASRTLAAPLSLLHNLVPVSQGSSIAREILGSGDRARSGQSFALQRFPVTYLSGGAPGSALPFRSSIRILVNRAPWTEVDSFVDQRPDARVFVSREDDDGRTHVVFGDGVNGARLPTGNGNVVAAYRHGAGGEAPAAALLSTLLGSVSGLSAIRSPVPIGGGLDAQPIEEMRRYAPLSTFALGNAISLDDYEAIAVGAGAKRARARYLWDGARRRALVKVHVGDDHDVVLAVEKAIAAAVDPNVPFLVEAISTIRASVGVLLRVLPSFDANEVAEAVRAALVDPEGSLFGAAARIGEPVYESQIAAVCAAVPGVHEIVDLSFSGGSSTQTSATPVTPGVPMTGKGVLGKLKPIGLAQVTQTSWATAAIIGASAAKAGVPIGRHSPGEGSVFGPADVQIAIDEEENGHAFGA